MAITSKLPPRSEGYWIFNGIRHTGRPGVHVRIHEPVQVCQVKRGRGSELGVALLGRQTRFRLETFEGTWQSLELEAT